MIPSNNSKEPKIDEDEQSLGFRDTTVTTTTIKDGAFAILASKGVWDLLTNEQAVNLISKHLDKSKLGGVSDVDSKDVHLDYRELRETDGHDEGCRFNEQDSVVKDRNPATHPIRNAAGGRDQQFIKGIQKSTL